MPKFRVGIVGAGPVGGLGGSINSHAGGYQRCEEVDLVAVSDLNSERLHQFGEEWGIASKHRYTSASAMYETAGLDIVSVATHNLYHHEPVIEAAEAGIKIIMVEKPLATSVALGRCMVDACEKNGCRLIVDHTRRFLPHYKRLREMINDGAIGDVKTITFSGARPLLHNGTHTVDGAFYFTSAEPILVSGYLSDEPVDDPGGGGHIVCNGGPVIFINCIATRKESLSDCIISGTTGRIQFCERRGIWEHGPLIEVEEDNGMTHDFKPIPNMPSTFFLDDYFFSAARETVECLLEDRESVSAGQDGLKALEVITAMHISYKTGAHISLPLAEGMDTIQICSTGK